MGKGKSYYFFLCRKAEEMNEEFKYEGSRDRACVLKDEKGKYKIVVFHHVNNPLNDLMNQLMESVK